MSEFKFVPARMLLDKETIGAINFHCGDGADGQFGEYSDGLLWVGTVTDDDGKEVHGLHLATAEYPEEGSTTLVEFSAQLEIGEAARLTAERDALQQRLTTADQRIDELEQALKFYAEREHYHFESGNWDTVSGEPLNILWCGDEPDFIEDGSVARAALFASAEPAMESKATAYKPGLYAVRHIDNWDGERDVVLTFALLDAEGKWTDKETGEPLLTYKGDKVLRAWPLDCSAAPGSQIIGVPRDWLEDWALELVEAAQDGGRMSNQVEHLLEIHPKP